MLCCVSESSEIIQNVINKYNIGTMQELQQYNAQIVLQETSSNLQLSAAYRRGASIMLGPFVYAFGGIYSNGSYSSELLKIGIII